MKCVHQTYEMCEAFHIVRHLTYKMCASDLQKLCIRPIKVVHPTYTKVVHQTYKSCASDLYVVYSTYKRFDPTYSYISVQPIYIRSDTLTLFQLNVYPTADRSC